MGFSQEDRTAFCKVLLATRNITEAAKAIGRTRRQAYTQRRLDPVFRASWDDAVNTYVDNLESKLIGRCTEGTLEAVYHRGEVVGHKTIHDNGTALRLLQALRPERYALAHAGMDDDDTERKWRDALGAMDDSIGGDTGDS